MALFERHNQFYGLKLNDRNVSALYLNGQKLFPPPPRVPPSFTTVAFTGTPSTINLNDFATGRTVTLAWNITGTIQMAEIYEQGNPVPIAASTNTVGTHITPLITTSTTYELRVTGTDGHVHAIKTVAVFARKRPIITLTPTFNNVPQSPSGNINVHLAIRVQLEDDDPLTSLTITPNLGTYGTDSGLLQAWNRHRVGDTFTLQAQVTSSYDTTHTVTATNIAGTTTATVRIKPV